MRKKVFLTFAAALLLTLGCAAATQAEIIPAEEGGWQIGPSAVVLCDSLSLRKEKDADSEALEKLPYGRHIIVLNQEEGWAECVLGDSEDDKSGWVNADFIAVNPAWYRSDEETVVYAWNDEAAPKVAVLDSHITLPILKDEGEWLIVSLRGAAGWIHKPERSAGKESTDQKAEADQNKSDSKAEANTESKSENGSDGAAAGEESSWFDVYAEEGDVVSIRFVAGAMYEDEQGRTYVKQEDDGYYYCITTDTTYAFDPTAWTGEAYGENQFPEDNDLTGGEYGENQFPEDND